MKSLRLNICLLIVIIVILVSLWIICCPAASFQWPSMVIQISNSSVFDAATGCRLSNAEVLFYDRERIVGKTRTNDSGQYSVRIRMQGTGLPTLVANHDGYHSVTNHRIHSFSVALFPCSSSACSKQNANPQPDISDMTRREAIIGSDYRISAAARIIVNSILNSPIEKNTAANELFSLPELPDGVVSDLARMAESADADETWRDYCLQFLGSALERPDGVTDADRALARETLVEALASTNATFAGTALRALHRGDPADPLVASNALRIARDPSYPSSSRTTALLILEDCARATPPTASTPSTASTLTETASAISADPSASSLLRRTAEAVQKRSSVQSHDQWNDRGGSQ